MWACRASRAAPSVRRRGVRPGAASGVVDAGVGDPSRFSASSRAGGPGCPSSGRSWPGRRRRSRNGSPRAPSARTRPVRRDPPVGVRSVRPRSTVPLVASSVAGGSRRSRHGRHGESATAARGHRARRSSTYAPGVCDSLPLLKKACEEDFIAEIVTEKMTLRELCGNRCP